MQSVSFSGGRNAFMLKKMIKLYLK